MSAQYRSVNNTLVEHFPDPETETLNQATSCPVLPDYLLVTTTVTEIYPVSATMWTPTNSQGRDIPVRLTRLREQTQPLRHVKTFLDSNISNNVSGEQFLLSKAKNEKTVYSLRYFYNHHFNISNHCCTCHHPEYKGHDP